MDFEKISVIVIDSDSASLGVTRQFFEMNPMVEDVMTAEDSDKALLMIISKNPDLVILEYPTVGNAGKELIQFIQTHLEETMLVLVSESKKHALAAIRMGIYNYRLKPLKPEDLENIAENVSQIKNSNNKNRISKLIEQTFEDKRLRLQTLRGYIILDPEEILYCKADGFYTEIFLTENRKELSYLFISKLNEILKQFDFMRVSRSYLVNLKFIRKIYKSNNTIVLSSNGQEYEVKSSKQNIRVLNKITSE